LFLSKIKTAVLFEDRNQVAMVINGRNVFKVLKLF